MTFLATVLAWVRKVPPSVAILVAAVGTIMVMNARIHHLQAKNDALEYEQKVIEPALADTSRVTPRVIHDFVPIYVPGPKEIAEADTVRIPADCPKPYISFATKEQWHEFWRHRCSGALTGTETKIWKDGRGAKVDYSLGYGGKEDESWMVISPLGRPPPSTHRFGLAAELHLGGTSRGAVAVGGGVSWRGWGLTGLDLISGTERPEQVILVTRRL